MSTACLVLAQTAPSILRETIYIYKKAGWDIFVHLDSKVEKEKYQHILGVSKDEFTFVPEPVEVFWGGYTMIKAQIKLIKYALSISNYDRFILLTDDTVPLRSPAELCQQFDSNIEFITAKLQTHGTFFERYSRFFLNDYNPTKMRGRNQDNVYVDLAFLAACDRLQHLWSRGKRPIQIHFGSQFWALTRAAIEIVLTTLENDEWLQQSFEFSALPDELVFQTILGNYSSSPRLDGPVFADFSVPSGPKILQLADLIEAASLFSFARKVDPNDVGLVGQLAQCLLGGGSLRTGS